MVFSNCSIFFPNHLIDFGHCTLFHQYSEKRNRKIVFFFFENRATFIQTLTAKKSEKGFIIKEKQSIFYDARKLKLKIVPNDH